GRGADQSLQRRRIRRGDPDGARDVAGRASSPHAPYATAAPQQHHLRLARRDSTAGDDHHVAAASRGGMTASALPVSLALAQRLHGTPMLVMLDVDGTLAPIAPTPDAAVVPDETKRIVAALARRPGVHVALVSGRSAADARRVVGVGHVWVVGNHGIEVVSPSGDPMIDERVEPYRSHVARAANRLRAGLAAVPGVLLENKQLTLSVHYRLADRAVIPRLEDVVREVATEQ